MTVAELIAALWDLPPDLPVAAECFEYSGPALEAIRRAPAKLAKREPADYVVITFDETGW